MMDNIVKENRSADRTLRVCGLSLEPTSLLDASRKICRWVDAGQNGYVITTNTQHLHLYKNDQLFKEAYDHARLRVIDGRPIRLLAKISASSQLPMCSGSDLIAPLAEAAAESLLTVGIIGATEEICIKSRDFLQKQYPRLNIVGAWVAPDRLKNNKEGARQLALDVSAVKPQLLFIGLGAPTQELWAYEYLELCCANAILCIGAGLEFLIGIKKRAPRWIRYIGIEFLWRLAKEPRRLWKRYTLAGFTTIKSLAVVIYQRVSNIADNSPPPT